MSSGFYLSHFLESIPNIRSNDELREPQVEAYEKVLEHFVKFKKKEHAIVVLPTGVGKTGLMGMLPYGISHGRVLIITPQLVIKDAVLDSLDPEHPRNFWIARKVFESFNELPAAIEYDSSTSDWELNAANIVILNVQKLQRRFDRSLVNRVKSDFFDMIIIDEAHHSTAPTWEQALEKFDQAKVVKVTGTPYRHDGEQITGEYVYKYPLSKAMAKGYTKSLERIHYEPSTLYLTLDKNDATLYTLDQIKEMKLKDDDWITRSVAYSEECSKKVAEASLKLLKEKRKSGLPHKIIGVACSIWHAEQLYDIYQKLDMRVTLVHSGLAKDVQKERLKLVENHLVDVVLHVAKLGEGYDHKYLSVAAIFRPFRSRLPYEQFVGRVLRSIDAHEVISDEDNIACVVHHKELNLEHLWKFYKEEKEKSDVIKLIGGGKDKYTGEKVKKAFVEKHIGWIAEEGEGRLVRETFIDTELLKEREARLEQERQKLAQLREMLPNFTDEQLLQMIRRDAEGTNTERILRPDKHLFRQKRSLDDRIKEEMIPELILKHKIPIEADSLKRSVLFRGRKYSWIPNRLANNAAMLACYLELRVNEMVGNDDRRSWTPAEYNIALERVEEIYELVDKMLESESL